jgi:hypothetical protein
VASGHRQGLSHFDARHPLAVVEEVLTALANKVSVAAVEGSAVREQSTFRYITPCSRAACSIARRSADPTPFRLANGVT